MKVVFEDIRNEQRNLNIVKSIFKIRNYTSESSSVLNISFQLLQTIENIKAEVQLRFPESPEDEQYLREIFRTSIDIAKIFKSLKATTIVRNGISKVLDSFNGTADFPLLPNYYQITNLTFDGKLLPPVTTKYMFVLKIFMRPRRKDRKFILTNLIRFYVKLN